MPEKNDHDVGAIVSWLADRIAKEMEVEPETILVDKTFANLGLGSLQVLRVTLDLGEHLGIEDIDVSLFWNYPTILEVADHLIASSRGTVSA